MKNKKTGNRQPTSSPPQTGAQKTQEIGLRLQQAVTLQKQGQFPEAGKIYREVLAVDPTNQDALHLSGVLALHDQKFDTAKDFISKAIASAPNIAVFHVSLGMALQGLGDLAGAEASYRQAGKLDPHNFDAVFHLGNLYKNMGKFSEAESCYKKGLDINPSHMPTLNNLGNIYRDLGKFQPALECYNKAIASDPTVADVYINMGNAYKDMLKPQEAVDWYHKAIEVNPDFPDPYNNIGYILQHTGKLSESITFYMKALELDPNLPEVYHNLGNVYKDMGEFPESIAAYRKAVAMRPDFTWAHCNILFAMNYDEAAQPAQTHREAKQWWRQQAAHLANQYPLTNSPDPDRKLRIGYVSPDFCLHSVSFFALPLIEKQNKNSFEIFCYSDVKNPDALTTRFQGLADHWRHITGQADEAVAQQIYDDKIDILFDLTGHTAYNRLLVFARRPAPVQISWLGYPNTTGVETIQYRITDAIADPPGTTDQYYTEKLIRLPHSFLCYSPPEGTPAIEGLPAIKNGQITFGSFNNITKTSESVVKNWCEILNRVEGSRIMLKSIAFADPSSQERFLSMFRKYGVTPDRILLKKRTATTEDHLNLYNEIDIGLDPFPYNGTTTTCEALWMGVPVVALRGDRHCARVSASILSNAGFEHLIAETPEEYVNKAVALANDLDQLRQFRKNARALLLKSVLLNKELFAQEIEEALKEMWRHWCASTKDQTPEKTEGEEMKPETADDLNRHGEELFEAGRFTEAADLFIEAIKKDPSQAVAHNNLGVLYYHLNQFDDALQCFRKTLELNPEDKTALENIGDLLQAMHSSATPPEPVAVKEEKPEDVVATMNSFPFWYHKIELPGGIVTPGFAPLDAAAYRVPQDLTGKRVLDVGAWDGYWSFEALKRGAKEVIAIDDFSDYLGALAERDRKAWETFDFCKRQLGYNDKQCKRLELSVYEANEAQLGRFDVIFFFGTLYHLRHPMLALDKLSALCDGEIFVETAILDDYSPYKGGLQKGYPGQQMVMEFYPGKEYGSNETNWWAPTLYCLINLIKAAGFNNCRGWKLTDNPQELPHCRGFAYGNKRTEGQAG